MCKASNEFKDYANKNKGAFFLGVSVGGALSFLPKIWLAIKYIISIIT